ncbi:MAG: hypothetical protein CMM48_04735 [Rhodospirillaceae bacterium]|nr:hypothetical protein [Rhodospirillaceae bacterium]HAA93883.1 hypothetical protein [Rhodospirillaceae bacterium]|tara:strand:+ start:89 stop:397 length:309 start_codon:yes stop_codon:yes gene_type:complete
MGVTAENTEFAIWFFLGLVALWIIFRLRRRAREADNSFRSSHRRIARRLAGENPKFDADDEEEEDIVTQEDWRRGRQQVILCFVALVLIVSLSVVSCLRGGL